MNKLLKTLLIVSFLSIPGSLAAQEVDSTSTVSPDTKKEAKKRKLFEHQLGFNATNFILTFLNFGGGGVFVPQSPYDFNYKLLLNTPGRGKLSSVGLRTGGGYQDIFNESKNQTSGSMFSNESKQLDLRVGGEAQFKVNKFWTIYAGIDYVMSDINAKSVNSFDWGGGMIVTTTTTTKQSSNGFGPVMGVQFNLGKRLCLATEASFYSMRGKGKSTTTSTFPGSIDQVNEQKSRNTSIILPAFINFNFRF